MPQTNRYAAITLPRFFMVRSSSPSPRQTARARRSSPHRLRGRYPLAVDVAAFCFDCHFFHRSEEHTSELQSLAYLVCRLLLEKKKQPTQTLSSRRGPSETSIN